MIPPYIGNIICQLAKVNDNSRSRWLEGGPDIAKFVESLKRRGVTENVISEAMAKFGGR
jgi:hypothetical protein